MTIPVPSFGIPSAVCSFVTELTESSLTLSILLLFAVSAAPFEEVASSTKSKEAKLCEGLWTMTYKNSCHKREEATSLQRDKYIQRGISRFSMTMRSTVCVTVSFVR